MLTHEQSCHREDPQQKLWLNEQDFPAHIWTKHHSISELAHIYLLQYNEVIKTRNYFKCNNFVC